MVYDSPRVERYDVEMSLTVESSPLTISKLWGASLRSVHVDVHSPPALKVSVGFVASVVPDGATPVQPSSLSVSGSMIELDRITSLPSSSLPPSSPPPSIASMCAITRL